MTSARTYSSPLRAEHAALTRDRIVDAAVALLNEGDSADIAMQDVAARAGVSVRTVYRNFATRDELFDGVVATLGQRVLRVFGTRPRTSDEYVATTADVVRTMSQVEPLYRALFATQAGRESHRRAAQQRRPEIAHAFAAELTDVSEHDATLFSGLIHLATSTQAALFLMDYWDFDPDDTGRALQWLVGLIRDALRDPQTRETI
jgi:AcrR family transcriptional regulator